MRPSPKELLLTSSPKPGPQAQKAAGTVRGSLPRTEQHPGQCALVAGRGVPHPPLTLPVLTPQTQNSQSSSLHHGQLGDVQKGPLLPQALPPFDAGEQVTWADYVYVEGGI